MVNLKKSIKDWYFDKKTEEYKEALERRTISFDSWIREKEMNLQRFDMTLEGRDNVPFQGDMVFMAKYSGVSFRIVPYSYVNVGFSINNCIEDIIVFVNGKLTDKAIPLLYDTFRNNKKVSVVYGDEDISQIDDSTEKTYGSSVTGTRKDPFFKPDWSPHLFLNHFYFCNIVAIRRVDFRENGWKIDKEGPQGIYELLLKYIFRSKEKVFDSVAHIEEILVHANDFACNEVSVKKASEYVNSSLLFRDNSGLRTDKDSLGVVIPSKDNPSLLMTCVESLKIAKDDDIDLHIVIVDNGSNAQNKEQICEFCEKENIRYEYIPSEFNFAKMCNYGASLLSDEFILFLNDDITFEDNHALKEMLFWCGYCFTGAVGIKLLYPNSNLIQHAGVFSTRIGPVHKMQFCDDTKDYYFGFNKAVANVSAVTGACLMVKKKDFDNVNGFDESLKVAFNDIELCFDLCENGLYNVVCNNIYAYHAESVTRGKDTDTTSLNRLNLEKEKLYSNHQGFSAADPFYNKYLLNDILDTRIVPANEYEYIRNIETATAFEMVNLSKFREDACLINSIEYAGRLSGYTYENDAEEKNFITGYFFVSGSNNACYKKFILLKKNDLDSNYEKEKVYAFPIKGCVRIDVSRACPDQENIGLSGFCLEIDRNLIEKGTYKVGVMASGLAPGNRIYSFSNKELVVR